MYTYRLTLDNAIEYSIMCNLSRYWLYIVIAVHKQFDWCDAY